MAKKKKTQLKPVARGFATTSVPKKITAIGTPAVGVEINDEREEGVKGDVKRENDTSAVPPVQGDESDPDQVDEQSLQNLVDKLQEKTEREIIRTVKAIEVERRFSRSLPLLELDHGLTDRILTLALESENGGSRKGEGKWSSEESDDKALARLGITYGVLRRLGFSDERVVECLHAIPAVDFDEAYDWLYLHCTEEELNDRRIPEASELKVPKSVGHQVDRIPLTPAHSLVTASPFMIKTQSRLNDSPILSAASRSATSSPSPKEIQRGLEHVDLKSHLLSSSGEAFSPLDSGRNSPETDAMEYAQSKLKYEVLMANQRFHRAFDAAQAQILRKRMDILKASYFFDEREAEELYLIERDKALQAQLEGNAPGVSGYRTTECNIAETQPPSLQLQAPNLLGSVPDIFDDESDDSSTGGVFALLDDAPAVVTNAQGKLIAVRDMAAKHWSGHTPTTLLREIIAKTDRYAVASYSIISAGTRAKQAAVSITWQGRKTEEWFMEDSACCDEEQAKQYIATVALHALTFPHTDGFSATTSASGGQTFFRLLPVVYRDLWGELEAARKKRDDAINRNLWSKVRTILESKLQFNSKFTGKSIRPLHETKDSTDLRTPPPTNEMISEQLATSFKVRQATAEYQQMLATKQEQRNLLPIAEYRETIIQLLKESQVLVLSGETGCGKSTQVPTFILEDQLSRGKPCKIYCTEPRRISAISLAHRVSHELGDPPNAVGTPNSLVGYSIRLESSTSRSTRLTFVTNGIALRMLEGGTGQGGQGMAFDEITHIIIDEVHERTIESDFLLIVLKSLLGQRSDLRVILMSATIDAEKISSFFGGCPMLHVPGRIFPVEVHFLEDAVELSRWSITENSPYARRRHDKFYQGKARPDWTEEMQARDDDDDNDETTHDNFKLEKRYSPETTATINLLDERLIPYDLIVRLLERICFDDLSYMSYSAAILIFMPGLAEIRRLNDVLVDHPSFGSGLEFKIYPLHSSLSSENQSAVFDIPPPGIRKLVIATNVAETGITIPDITCVIDTGKHREMRFDEKRQISRLVETFIARSNAAQRRGRAGRLQRGLCFHLFTRLRHDTQMADNPQPEMMRLSLSDLALRIKIMKVKLGPSIEDILSRALDPPAPINVQRAISMLVEVRALSLSEEITPMGRLLSKLPTDVHLGKFLLIATLFRCLDPALTIAATLNSKSPFVTPFGFEQEADRAKQSFRLQNSDFLTIHNAFVSWRRACSNPSFVRKFCRTNYLSHQNLQQIEDLRQQFLGYLIDSSFIHVEKSYIRELSRARYSRGRARFVAVPPELDINSTNNSLINAALTAGLFPKILAIDSTNGYMQTISNNRQASLHPSSVNFGRRAVDFGVNHLAYFTLMHSKKLYAWETGPVDDMAMLLLCGDCDFKISSNSAFIDRKIKFRIPAKSNIALKILRNQLGTLLANQFRGKTLNETQVLWNELALMVLGRINVQDSAERSGIAMVSDVL